MTIPTLTTERLLLKPLVAEDAAQIQTLYPRWEIVRYMVSSVPWPYPDNGAENYVNNVALPDMAKGIAWFWSIRRREVPDELMGIICLYDVEDNNRGFWLAPEFQGQGYMREASIAVTDYWFNTLNKSVLRAPKAAANSRSRRISDSSGMRLIRTEKKAYVSGMLDSELWEITRDEWNARQQIAFHHVADGVQRQIVIFCAERVFQLFRQGVQRDKGVGDQRRDKRRHVVQIHNQRERQHDAEQIHRAVQNQRIGKRHRRCGNALAAGKDDGHIVQTVVQAQDSERAVPRSGPGAGSYAGSWQKLSAGGQIPPGVVSETEKDSDRHAENAKWRDGKFDAQRGIPRQHQNNGDRKQEVEQQSRVDFGKYRTVPDKNQL
ncbi:hypothetical protein L1887_45676 [Cichorium endivia]|nr:hypothetical protein L1887_45676 [Cichorium endivia]